MWPTYTGPHGVYPHLPNAHGLKRQGEAHKGEQQHQSDNGQR